MENTTVTLVLHIPDQPDFYVGSFSNSAEAEAWIENAQKESGWVDDTTWTIE